MYKVYQVLQNDTLNSIAKKLNVNLNELVGINGINENTTITPGSFLVVPASKSIFVDYTIQKGDTLYSIARKYNLNVSDLLQLNGMNADDYLYPGTTILVPSGENKIYITKDGDTLEKVADFFSTDQTGIISDNENIYLLPNQLIIYKKG